MREKEELRLSALAFKGLDKRLWPEWRSLGQSPWGGHQEGTVCRKHGAGTDATKTEGQNCAFSTFMVTFSQHQSACLSCPLPNCKPKGCSKHEVLQVGPDQ